MGPRGRLPSGHHVGGRGGGGLNVEVHLPSTLKPLFPGLERRVDVEAETVAQALEQLEERYLGLRALLCEPGPKLRPHIHVYVDKERADVDTPVREGARLDVIAAISGG